MPDGERWLRALATALGVLMLLAAGLLVRRVLTGRW